jgi:acyl-CoA thioesterase-1
VLFGEATSRVAERNGPSEAQALDVPADAPRVVFLGDSITAGLHLPAHEAFPAVLQGLLAAEGRPFHLVNAGVSGDTSAGGLRRIDWVLRSKPDVLVVELGGNDGLRGQPVASIEANLRAIVGRARAAGTEVLLLGMRLPPSYGQEYAGEFAKSYDRIAFDMKLTYVPFFMQGVGGIPGMNLEDGLHPSAAGQRRLAQNVLHALRPLIRATSESGSPAGNPPPGARAGSAVPSSARSQTDTNPRTITPRAP